MRSFQVDWYKTYPWIEYSIKLDAAFCFPCRIYLNYEKEAKYIEDPFIKTGFKTWKKALEENRG